MKLHPKETGDVWSDRRWVVVVGRVGRGRWKGRRLTFPAHVNKTKSTIKIKSMEPILRVPLALEKLNVSLKSSTGFGASGN